MAPGNLLIAVALVGAAAALAGVLGPRLIAWRRERRYAELLEECLARQPEHEQEHVNSHGGQFTAALRIGNLVNRLQRKIHAARLPPLSREERTRRVKEALRARA